MSSELPRADRPPAISIRSLTKTYQIYRRPHHRLVRAIALRTGWGRDPALNVSAVEDVSFNVAAGETVVILGKNGSGKSTLLQMIAGSLTPTAGELHIDGKVSALLELGAGFNPDYTGRENLRLSARIFGLSPSEVKAAEPEIEAFADIGGFIDEPVRTYSSGMYVRLAFATAVHMIPDIFIVDEALAVGDIFFQQKCIDHLVNRMRHAAKLIVTHDPSTAARLGDRCIVMDQGHLLFDGDPLRGIEFFTSLNLRGRGMPDPVLHSAPAPVSKVEPVEGSQRPEAPDSAWMELDPGKSSNPSSLVFRRVGIGVRDGDNVAWTANPTLVGGSRIVLVTDVELARELEKPIFGYQVRDRVGNVVFGQNTIGSGLESPSLPAGRYRVGLEIDWPEIAEGEYLVTLGVGSGHHPLHHYIVCWGMNLFSVTSAPTRAVHGFFNADITNMSLHPL